MYVAHCGTGEEALRNLPPNVPDVVVDGYFCLPRMAGIECTVRLKGIASTKPNYHSHGEDDKEELVVSGAGAGADWHMLMKTTNGDLRRLAGCAGRRSPDESQSARR